MFANKSGFGAPSNQPFGATPSTSFGFGTQPAAAPNPFGQSQLFNKPNPPAGGFGTAPTPGFGQPTTNPMFQPQQANPFGAPAPSTGFGSGAMFGQHQQQQPQQSAAPLFGSTAFGQQSKPAFGSFGSAQTGTIFGHSVPSQAQPATSMFQPSGSASIFGSSSFVNPSAQTGTTIKFNPLTGSDTMQKGGIPSQISTKHYCITCMKEYENKSLEELRYEDYVANRKGPQQSSGFAAGPFGSQPSAAPSMFASTSDATKAAFGQPGAFGQATPSFGQPSTGFGLSAQPSAQPTGLFGKPNTGFGSSTAQTNSFSAFGTTSTAPSFGAAQPKAPFANATQTSLFGSNPSTQQPGFAGGGAGMFGQSLQTSGTTSNLFGKSTQPTTGFNAGQTSGFSFNPPATTSNTLFQAPKPTTGFGMFGQTSAANTGFGQPSSFGPMQSSFGNFGKAPTQGLTQTAQPFSSNFQGLQQPQQSIGLFGSTAAKPGGLFGNNTTGGGLFSNAPMSSMSNFNMQQQQQQQQPLFPCPPAEQESYLDAAGGSPFGHSAHLTGLQPFRPEPQSSYATNPAELKSIIERSSPRVSSFSTSNLNVILPGRSLKNPFIEAALRDENDMMQKVWSRGSPKRLIIKKQTEPVKTIDENDEETVRELKKLLAEKTDRNQSGTEAVHSSNVCADNESGNRSLDCATQTEVNNDSPLVSACSTPIPDEIPLITPEPFVKSSGPVNATTSSPASTVICPTNSSTPYVSKVPTLDVVPSSYNPNKKHPCGIVLTRPEYYTIPDLQELENYLNDDGTCIVQGFTVGRSGYGNVYFPEPMDVCNLNLDEIVFFRYREISVYPDEATKPPEGTGLNRKAQVTLDHMYPKQPVTGQPITDVKTIMKSTFPDKLKRVSERQGSKFLEYRPETGSWVFSVAHFSKFGFDKDEDDTYYERTDDRPPRKIDLSRQRQCKGVTSTIVDSQKLEKILKTQSDISSDSDESEFGGIYNYKSRAQHKEVSKFKGLGGIGFSNKDYLAVNDFLSPISVSLSRTALNFEDDTSSVLINSRSSPSTQTSEIDLGKKIGPRKRNSFLDVMMDTDMTACNIDEIVASRKVHLTAHDTPVDVLLNHGGVVPKESSFLGNMRCCIDLSLFNQFKFKPGWMQGMQYFTVKKEICVGRSSSSLLDLCQITNDEGTLNYETIIESLEIVLTGSTLKDHTFQINKGFMFLKEQNDLYKLKASQNSSFKYYSSIWELCLALWGPLLEENELRRDYVSKWLAKTLYHSVVDSYSLEHPAYAKAVVLDTVFHLLSLNQVYEAAQYALINNYPQLSLLISQLNTSDSCRYFLQEQIIFWYNAEMEAYIPEAMKKILLLMSGNSVFQDINVCKDLDWKRSFGMHLWFIAPPNAPVHECLNVYKDSFDTSEAYAAVPVPPYSQNSSRYDILYHLMFLYCSNTYILNHVLDPLSYTPNPTDFSLSWLMLQFFHSLDIGLISDSCEMTITLSFVLQLENAGHWKWAVFVAMFIKDAQLKKKHITGILQRNFDVEGDMSLEESKKTEHLLVHQLHVPVEWIHEFRASKAEYLNDNWKAFANFCYLGEYYEGNEIFVDKILPSLFINEHHKEINLALAPFQNMPYRITTWKNEIGLILSYIKLLEMCKDKPEINLEKFYHALMDVFTRIHSFPKKNLVQKLCVAELAKGCAHIQRMLFDTARGYELYFPCSLQHMEETMPPDYILDECVYIVGRSVADQENSINTLMNE